MADIIDKIGKYFADQETQMREMYAHAAATAAASSAPATRVKNAAPQPPPRGETDVQKFRYGRVGRTAIDNVVETAPSLVRTRLSLTKQREELAYESVARAKDEAASWVNASSSLNNKIGHETVSNRASSRSWHEGSSDTASEVSLSARSMTASDKSHSSRKTKAVKKKKKKKTIKQNIDTDEQAEREKAQQRAMEGFARAQERARRIQQERATQDKQQQLEREANAAKTAEEMRKIEEIRRKGKQFAMRLRPQSAPTTPQSHILREQQSRGRHPAQNQETDDATVYAEAASQSWFLDGLERDMYDQMMAEMALNEAIHNTRTREQEEWTRLQAQIRKTTDRNAIKQERVHSLTKTKENLLKEISENEAEAAALRHERHQLEEKSKRERQLKQREAEREIHARLRREESQRLVDDERVQSDHAAEARAKAKMRVQSRAALLKRVLHGCDIRSGRNNTPQNQAEDSKQQRKARIKTPIAIEAVPELAEFEEDGLSGEGVDVPANNFVPLASPTKTIRRSILQATHSTLEPSFMWQVPALTMPQIHSILREECDSFIDSD